MDLEILEPRRQVCSDKVGSAISPDFHVIDPPSSQRCFRAIQEYPNRFPLG